MKQFEYTLCGMRVRTALELPGLHPSDGASAEPDVMVSFGTTPRSLPDATRYPTYELNADAFLFAVPAVGRYWVHGAGAEVVIEPHDGADERDLRVFFLGSVFGAVCHLRGVLPLHASAVRLGDACVAFAGPSGIGKSTIAALLVSRGYALVSDDLCVVTATPEGALVWPGFPQVKLWEDGVAATRADVGRLARVRGRMNKYHVPLKEGFDPRPVRAVRVHIVDEGLAGGSVQRLRGLDAVHAVADNTYRKEFVQPMARGPNHFRLCAALAATAAVFRMPRPTGGFDALERALTALEAEWRIAS